MLLRTLVKHIENILPPETAMEGDRIGLQIDSDKREISDILVSLELTDEVIDEALKLNSDCVVVFHPLIFMPLKNIRFDERVGRLVSKLIKNDIALISVHTAYDAFYEGTNKILADLLELKITGNLVPDKKHENFGMGVIAEASKSLKPEELLNKVHNICRSPLKFTEGASEKISKVVIVGGSGSSFMGDALKSGADAFITADITYHTFHAVKGKIWLIDPGHYELEQFVGKGIAKLLKAKLGNELKSITASKTHTNPVGYFPDSGKYRELQKELLIK